MALLVSSGTEAVTKAKAWLGTPYCWGGGHAGPVKVGTCVDCSGLVNQVFGTTGNTFSQVQMGTGIASINDAGPGDLVFFGPIAPGEPHHVGIYMGGGQMIDAPHTGTVVRKESINGFGPVNAIRRLVPTNASGDGSGNSALGVQYTYAQLEGVWIQAGGSAQTAPMAAAIAMAESGGSASASNVNTNNSVDRGLWQINSVHGSQSSFDVMTNARAAIAISNNGTNWRPWCTAYGDGACGSKGGAYLAPGAPFQKFLNPNATPDFSAPINATNAAANQPGQTSPTVQEDAFLGGGLGGALCILQPTNCDVTGATQIDHVIAGAIKAVMHSILNPIIQPIAGAMGIAAGGVLMIGGAWILVSGTRTGGGAGQLGRSALIASNPELGAFFARTGGERAAFVSARTQRRAEGARTGQSRQEASQRRVAADRAYAQRQEAMNTQEQLKRETAAYREYLRRTRPPTRGRGPTVTTSSRAVARRPG